MQARGHALMVYTYKRNTCKTELLNLLKNLGHDEGTISNCTNLCFIFPLFPANIPELNMNTHFQILMWIPNWATLGTLRRVTVAIWTFTFHDKSGYRGRQRSTLFWLRPGSLLGMVWGIPRSSFPDVPNLFSLPDSPRNRFYHSSRSSSRFLKDL